MNTNLSSLAKNYLTSAVESLTRRPSPNLKSADFRATLQHWSALSRQALKVTDGKAGKALVLMVKAEAAANNGPMESIRLIQQVMRQTLWQAAVDTYRADNPCSTDKQPVQAYERLDSISNPPAETNRPNYGDHPIGLDPEQDQDYVTPPTADEARGALIEVNGWLTTVADLLFAEDDANGREFFRLTDGLEYTTKTVEGATGDTLYIPVHNVDEALELQMEINQRSFEKRMERRVQARAAAFDALAKLVG